MADLSTLIRSLVGKIVRELSIPSRRTVIVVSVAAGPPRVVTYKMFATDTKTYTARIWADVVSPAAGDVVFLDTVDGDPMIVGRQ